MEKSTAQKLKLGVFVILGTALLVVASYLIGNRQNMFGQNFTIEAVFKNVNGLQKGNNVRYAGINVGTVSDIDMENDTLIRVLMLIEEKMHPHIKTDAIATIGSDGLVGSMIVNIIPGNGNAPLVQDGSRITSYSRIGAEDMLSTLNVTNENAALLTADLLKVTTALRQGKGTLGRLLNDTVMANNLEQTIYNLNKASREADIMFKELNSLTKGIKAKESIANILLTDTLSGQRVKEIMVNLEISSKNMATVTSDLDSLVKDLDQSSGAFNYLTQDTTLVNRLSATMKNIEEGTAKFNENMEALKHSFLTRGYFKKLERKERKAAAKQNNSP
ncbi:MlaD family protein [Lentiprolixibacter aurantiacus]|uniref:MlaD family protein n=1 Tax=Lentiprolixibacter aurantiacus TaxID=2993939 RepID=A0AAE3MN33_9FLAO|nr:MlaD family protein [Lentiprolixibacter aurantiacus]MCX2720776.1 MlaD family protein [Lentiprolixibacter aurantiacus]